MSYGQAQTVGTQTSRLRKKLENLCGLFLIASITPLLSMLTGCSGIVTDAKQTSSKASFQLSPSSVNFGQVVVGKQATQVVSVSNTGSVGINITRMTLSDSHFSLTGMTTPMALAAGQSGSFTIGVNPTTSGALTGTLAAQGDGGSTPVVVNLSATGMSSQAQLSANPTTINFGTVSTELKATSNLVLTNSGASNLTISLFALTGADFTISGIATPQTLTPGRSAQAIVTFSPTAAGSATGNLSITSNDPVNPTVSIPLTGSGTSAATGELNANSTSLSFGTVTTATSAEKQILLTNTGNAAVKISSITSVGPAFSTTGVTTPAMLSPSQSATLTASFSPAAAGSSTGTITIVSDAANSPLKIVMSGTGAQAGLSISPASFNFGSVVDGQTKSQSITVTNTGTAALTIGQVSASGSGYSVSGLATPATVPTGGEVTFSVLFAPTTAGSLTGTVSIASNAPNSPSVLSLSGTGTAASVTITANPTSVSFTNVNAGSSSSKNVTITNSGNTSVTLSQIAVNAKDFKTSGISTPATLAAGQSATLNVSFNPAASENVGGNVTVSSSQGASAVIAVSGTAVQPGLTITPTSASFGNVSVGSPATQTVQLTNSGTGTLTVTQVSVAGSGFSAGTLSLPVSLNSGQSTNLNVQFAPASGGTASGSVTILSNAPTSPSVMALSGTGVAATQVLTFSSTNLGFGSVNTGSSSTQSVTVTNTGNASVTVSQITESGAGFTINGAGTPVTLSAGQSLTFSVIFSPSTAGSDAGTVTVTSTASASPTTIALSGTGVQPVTHSATLTWTASTSTVSGYNVYRSTTNGSGYAKINSGLVPSVTYNDTTVQSGTTYYYVVTAVDASGDESADSNQATAVIP
jgi:centrosomal CEP192-like protein/HYDIN/CFA65/VesB family protein/ASPM-SPD-2-Hydin domain-containing protein